MELLDQMSQVSQEDKETIRKVLGERAGVITLKKLSDTSQGILKKAGLTIESKLVSIVKDAVLYILPFLVAIAIAYVVYRVIKRVLANKKKKNKPPLTRIVVTEGSSRGPPREDPEELESMI